MLRSIIYETSSLLCFSNEINSKENVSSDSVFQILSEKTPLQACLTSTVLIDYTHKNVQKQSSGGVL